MLLRSGILQNGLPPQWQNPTVLDSEESLLHPPVFVSQGFQVGKFKLKVWNQHLNSDKLGFSR